MSQEKLLSEEMIASVEDVSFGDGVVLEPLNSDKILSALKEENNLGLDSRVSLEGSEHAAPLFEGLAFDPEKLRVQAFVLLEKEGAIGIMTMIIAPKPWIEEQRYFERVDDKGVIVRDFDSVSEAPTPEFLIIPGWTKIDPKYSTKFAMPGFTAFKRLYKAVLENAPENTWVEVQAQGKHLEERNRLKELADRGVGTFIGVDELAIPLNDLGVNYSGSTSSVKMARLIGLKKADNVAALSSFGPVFLKQVR